MCWRRPNVPVCGPRIPTWSITLVAAMELIRLPTLSVCMGGCLRDTSFGVWTLKEFARFIRLLEFDSLTILGKILSILPSSIREVAVFLSSVKDRWMTVSSLSSSSTSLRTLRASSLLQISSLMNGVPILLWLCLLSPIKLFVRTSLSLVRKVPSKMQSRASSP